MEEYKSKIADLLESMGFIRTEDPYVFICHKDNFDSMNTQEINTAATASQLGIQILYNNT